LAVVAKTVRNMMEPCGLGESTNAWIVKSVHGIVNTRQHLECM